MGYDKEKLKTELNYLSLEYPQIAMQIERLIEIAGNPNSKDRPVCFGCQDCLELPCAPPPHGDGIKCRHQQECYTETMHLLGAVKHEGVKEINIEITQKQADELNSLCKELGLENISEKVEPHKMKVLLG